MPHYFIRLGAMAEIHRASSPMDLIRGRRVIVRTPRGVELAELVSRSCDPISTGKENDNGSGSCHQILRETSDEDELLIRRLDRHKRTAIENCRRELSEASCSAVLLDVDHLFDGGTLVMHFLGPVDEVVESITQRVVAQYESVIRSRHLAKLMREGCGPGCGENESGECGTACSSGGCSGCAVKSFKKGVPAT